MSICISPRTLGGAGEEPQLSLANLQAIKEQLLTLQKELSENLFPTDPTAPDTASSTTLGVPPPSDQGKMVVLQDFSYCPDDSILPPHVVNTNSLLADSRPMSLEEELRMMEGGSDAYADYNARNSPLLSEHTTVAVEPSAKKRKISGDNLALVDQDLMDELKRKVEDLEANLVTEKDLYQADMARVKKERDATECNLKTLSEKYNLTVKQMEELKSSLQSIKDELIAKAQQIDAVHTEKKECEESIKNLKSETLHLQQTLEKTEKQVEVFKSQVQEKEESLKDHKNRLSEKENQIELLENSLEQKLSEIENNARNLEESLGIKNDKILELEATISQYETIKNDTAVTKVSVEDGFKAELNIKNENIKSLSCQLTQLKQEYQSMRDESEALTTFMKQSSEKVDPLVDCASFTTQTFGSDISCKFNNLPEKLDWLVEEFRVKDNREKDLQVSIDNMKQMIDKKGSELKALTDSHEAEVNKLVSIISVKDEEKEELKSSLEKEKQEMENQLKFKLASKEKQLKDLELTATDCEQELHRKERELEEKLAQASHFEDRLRDEGQEMQVLKSALSEAEDKHLRLKDTLCSLETEMKDLREKNRKFDSLSEENDTNRKMICAMEEEIVEYKLSNERILGTNRDNEEKIQQLRLEATRGVEVIQKIEANNKSLQEKFEKHELELSEKCEQLLSLQAEHAKCGSSETKSGELERLQTELETCKADLQVKCQELQDKHQIVTDLNDMLEKMKALEDANTALETDKNSYQLEFEATELKLQKLTHLNEKLREKAESQGAEGSSTARKEMEDLQRKYSQLEEECGQCKYDLKLTSANLHTREKLIENAKFDLKEAKTLVQTQKDELLQVKMKLEDMKSTLQNIRKLYKLWSNADRELNIRELLSIHEEESGVKLTDTKTVTPSADNLAELQQKLQEREEAYKRLEQEYDQEIENFSQELERRTEALGTMPDQIDELQDEKEKYLRLNSTLQRKVSRMQSENEKMKLQISSVQSFVE